MGIMLGWAASRIAPAPPVLREPPVGWKTPGCPRAEVPSENLATHGQTLPMHTFAKTTMRKAGELRTTPPPAETQLYL